ncbi:MAG: mannonate dehydratase [Flavobacteriia bacterium]|nr:MAG: mannonate dehydratase [Flavobacteriia bacterium]
MSMLKTWRWFGVENDVPLKYIRQSGVKDIVTSLNHVPYGEEWTVEDIMKRKQLLEENGLKWTVTESVPVHEDIKTRTGNYKQYIENYKTSIKNLASCGIYTVCYNFMPIMDWTRTSLDYTLENGVKTLKFEWNAFAAFDLFILERENADKDYTSQQIKEAKAYFDQMSEQEITSLTDLLIANLPGTDESYTMQKFKEELNKYSKIDRKQLKQHLFSFLEEIIPVAEETGVKMCIHPDDPPFSLMGLPRIVSTKEDISELLSAVESPNNGLTFCTGSLGAGEQNDLPAIFKAFADKVHFLHLRSTQRDEDGNFYEASHLGGNVDMYSIVKLVVEEQERRKQSGRNDFEIPVRPDHGYQMMDDLDKKFYPGYSNIGRLKGLAELTGLEYGIERSMNIV